MAAAAAAQVQQPIDETAALRAALEASNRRAADSDQRRVQAETRLQSETGNRLAAQETAIDNAITTTEGEAASLQQQWTALQTAGDFEKAGEVMRKMSDASARAAQYRSQKEWVVNQRAQAQNQPAPQQNDILAPLTSAQRAWAERNPRYLSDPEFRNRANAAGQYASGVKKLAPDSDDFFKFIESDVYPERTPAATTNNGNPPAARQEPAAPNADVQVDPNPNPSPFSDTGEDDPVPPARREPTGRQEQTLEAHPVSRTQEPPVMRINVDPDAADPDAPAPQNQRAVGNGGGGIRAVAAPPSRVIREASNRAAQRSSGRIEPTQDELEHAIALYDAIEPNAKDKSPEAAVRWYYAQAHDGSNTRGTKRSRSWARDAVIS